MERPATSLPETGYVSHSKSGPATLSADAGPSQEKAVADMENEEERLRKAFSSVRETDLELT